MLFFTFNVFMFLILPISLCNVLVINIPSSNKRQKQFWIEIGIGVLAVELFSSKAVMVKLAYQYNVDASTILLLRMLFYFPFSLVVLLINTKKVVYMLFMYSFTSFKWVGFFTITLFLSKIK